MGKRKLKLEMDNDPQKRIAAFKRRYKTIFTKLIELHAFTGTRLMLVMYNGDTNTVYQYSSEYIDSMLASLEEYEGECYDYRCEVDGQGDIKTEKELTNKERGLLHFGSTIFKNSKIESTVSKIPFISSEPKEDNLVPSEMMRGISNSSPLFQGLSEFLDIDKFGENYLSDESSYANSDVNVLFDEV